MIEALPEALDRTVRGKRRRPDVAWLLFRREAVLEDLAARLADGRWFPMGFRIHWLRRPKLRPIARASVEDRVVHNAVVGVLEPSILRSASPAALASVPGGGTHRALLRIQAHLRRHRYALHLDLRACFPSVNPDLALELLSARVTDAPLLRLLGQLFDSGRRLYACPEVRRALHLPPDWPPPGHGLPIGSSFSRLVANHVMLDALDHHLQRRIRVPGYTRYVDDLVLVGDRRADLRAWRAEVAVWLDRERGMRVKHPDAPVLSALGGLGVLGHHVSRDAIVPFPRAARKLAARLRAAAVAGEEDVSRLVAGSLGWLVR